MGILDRFTSSDDAGPGQAPDKYRLRATAGPSYDISQHQIVPVNGEDAVTISNEFITAKIKVRVRGYRGLPTGSPSTSVYFDDPIHDKDQYSLAFSFVPKQDLPSVDTVWGNDFDHPIRDRLPPGFNTAFKIVKEFIDPGLACDAYADEPWLYGPSLSCWFAFRVGDKVTGDDFPAPNDNEVMRDGADGSGQKIRRDLGIPENNEKRRKFFLDANNRKSMVFEKGRLYQADFYNPYLDFGNLALKLPGFSLKVYKYIDAKSHRLRYVFKNRETGDMYLNVNFNLLWGEKLEEALAKEKQAPSSTVAQADEPAGSKTAEESRAQDHKPEQQASERQPTQQLDRRHQEKQQSGEHSFEGQQSNALTPNGLKSAEQSERHTTQEPQSSEPSKHISEDPLPADQTSDARQAGSSQPGAAANTSSQGFPQPAQQIWVSQDDSAQVADGKAVEGISEMLKNTATSDKQGQRTHVLD